MLYLFFYPPPPFFFLLKHIYNHPGKIFRFFLKHQTIFFNFSTWLWKILSYSSSFRLMNCFFFLKHSSELKCSKLFNTIFTIIYMFLILLFQKARYPDYFLPKICLIYECSQKVDLLFLNIHITTVCLNWDIFSHEIIPMMFKPFRINTNCLYLHGLDFIILGSNHNLIWIYERFLLNIVITRIKE